MVEGRILFILFPLSDIQTVFHLQNTEDLADGPIQGEPGGQIVKEEQHDDRHGEHHLLLGRIHVRRSHLLLEDHQGGHCQHQRMDAVAEQEEVHFLLGSPAEESGIEKIKYGTNTDNCISYLYHYQEDTGAYIYDLLVVKNLKGADGLEGSAVVLVESDDMAVILAARQMADTIEIVGTQMDNALSEESLSRTDRIYELLCPEQAAAIKNPVEVEGGSIFEAFSIENLENQNADKAEWAIWFEKPTYILAPGEKVTPVLIGPGKDEKIKYRISNENVATVNAKGEVTGIADGFVMLVATNEHGASCNTYCDVIAPEGGE